MVRRLALLCALLAVACGGPAPLAEAPAAPSLAATPAPLPAPTTAEAEDDATIPVTSEDPTRGSRTAYVTLVLFSDFECPFCARVARTIEQLREEYGDEELRVVWKNQPLSFHAQGKLAAVVGQGVFATRGANAFWTYHDAVLRDQQTMDARSIRDAAKAVGLSERELDAGLRPGGAWTKKVERDMELAERIGASATPTSFINGTIVTGAQPLRAFKRTIDGELAKAKAMAARGVPRERIYREAAADNFRVAERLDDDVEDTAIWNVPVGDAPARGPATALVTIVVFSDYQCPFCKRAEATLSELQREYGDKVRVVWRDLPLPFHARARPAANLAREARRQKGDAGFWDVHDRLFASQPELEDADLASIAKGAGLDVAKALKAVASEAHKDVIGADLDLADELRATGTPHFFINGRRFVGAQPVANFRPYIDDALRKAEALVHAGTPPESVYEATIRGGLTKP